MLFHVVIFIIFTQVHSIVLSPLRTVLWPRVKYSFLNSSPLVLSVVSCPLSYRVNLLKFPKPSVVSRFSKPSDFSKNKCETSVFYELYLKYISAKQKTSLETSVKDVAIDLILADARELRRVNSQVFLV